MYNGQAILTWLPNSDPDIAGYYAYSGPSPGALGYDTKLDVGTALTHTFTGFAHDTHHYFAVTAYDFTGNESTFSAEVHKLITVTVLQLLRRVV